MHKVYYIAESDFTIDNAATCRVLHNALSISDPNKFLVTIIGYSNVPKIVRKGFIIKNVKKGDSRFQKLLYFIFRGISIVKFLKKENTKPDIIIYYGISSRILLPLLYYRRTNNIKLISDVVEWYDYSHLPMGQFGLLALDVRIAITRLIPKCDGVIAISSFLENYYKEKELRTLRVPVTINSSEVKIPTVTDSRFDSEYLNLIYAGIPGKKDLIFNLIDTVQELTKEGFAIRFHLLGTRLSDLENKYPHLDNDAIICHGRVPQSQVASYLKKADFSVLLRPQKRYAQAGFPTKFVESFNAGLPVIANLTSDLSLYLKDGVNGFVVKDLSSDALKNTLKRIVKINRSQFKEMRYNAKNSAKLNFDYHLYVKDLEDFLINIMYY
jgi:glycosyltransferase involved in cell wall biosynthesis